MNDIIIEKYRSALIEFINNCNDLNTLTWLYALTRPVRSNNTEGGKAYEKANIYPRG